MISLRTRRSRLACVAVAATGMLLVGPSSLAAQEAVTTPKTHTVKKGDTLWDLAALYLGDAFRWPELYRLNTDVVEDPHWIYPDEILKLPGYAGTAAPELAPAGRDSIRVTPPTALPIDSMTPRQPLGPTRFARPGALPVVSRALGQPDTSAAVVPSLDGSRPGVRYGDYISAPWVDRLKGPPVWGRILASADIPGIEPARQRRRFQLNDRILIAPPTGSVAPERELFLAYHNGPMFEEVGQVIVPTGIVEVIRPPINGEAAIARIVRMFGEVSERDRLVPFDESVLPPAGAALPVRNGAEGKVRWVNDEPVLPAVNYFIVLSLTSGDGVKSGDELQLFRARQKAQEEGGYATPEIPIGSAQVIRVTPFGSTAMITRLEQPKVEKGTSVRVVGRIQ